MTEKNRSRERCCKKCSVIVCRWEGVVCCLKNMCRIGGENRQKKEWNQMKYKCLFYQEHLRIEKTSRIIPERLCKFKESSLKEPLEKKRMKKKLNLFCWWVKVHALYNLSRCAATEGVSEFSVQTRFGSEVKEGASFVGFTACMLPCFLRHAPKLKRVSCCRCSYQRMSV